MAAPCGRSAPPLVLIALSAAFLTYNALLSSRSFLPLPDSSSFPTATASSRRLAAGSSGGRRAFHTAVTASGSVYNTWQCRIMYHWFKEARRARSGAEMGGFTRILHSGKPDEFVDEIPTFVADPLPEGDQGYIVLNRPWAFVQWLQRADIQEEYILMAEPDHIIVKPIPNLSRDGRAAAFPFFYIDPKKYENVLRKFFPEYEGLITKIDPIGNSPVIIEKESLARIAPTWMNISIAMKKDPEADKAFGWVLEMYAYAVASALHGVGNILRKDFMIQPPWDLEVGDAFIIHYTYGCDYDVKGKLTYGKIGEWRFDKRSYEHKPPPRNLPLPPNGVPESVVTLVKMVNEATINIPNWESYAAD
ncbi:hydroxyproline O-arabinosyltransferase 1-like [Phragmites australis]|uniref:hydroxyproline O-arabinosyltransferase 1-like n=1 Tax=Phragmites australis TaxID=29695 RepID=UPI002D78989D|nr:hydroxyproline O-arabinosyltransferase 1-like [Phragmites australis]